jgi:hypothetical protein
VDIKTCQPVVVTGSGFTTLPVSVVFAATRGLLYSRADCSDSGGNSSTVSYTGTGSATGYVMSSSAGATTVTATALSSSGTTLASTSLPLTYISTVANSLTMQASPSTVTTGSKTTVTATVRDVNGNPVYNKTVVFGVSGGGQLSATSAVTDASGNVSVTFTADSSTSGNSSVVITATVQGTSVSGTTTVTVSGVAINIVIGTDNLISILTSPPRYQKNFGASVTDSNGSPVANKTVTISLLGTAFYKGSWSAGTDKWYQTVNTACAAEDTNNDGVIESGEPGDLNKSGKYEPNGAATISATSSGTASTQITVTTDSLGFASFYLTYLENFASWVQVQVTGTTTVNGATSSASSVFDLPYPASAVSSITVTPPFRVSPYGSASGCDNTN